MHNYITSQVFNMTWSFVNPHVVEHASNCHRPQLLHLLDGIRSIQSQLLSSLLAIRGVHDSTVDLISPLFLEYAGSEIICVVVSKFNRLLLETMLLFPRPEGNPFDVDLYDRFASALFVNVINVFMAMFSTSSARAMAMRSQLLAEQVLKFFIVFLRKSYSWFTDFCDAEHPSEARIPTAEAATPTSNISGWRFHPATFREFPPATFREIQPPPRWPIPSEAKIMTLKTTAVSPSSVPGDETRNVEWEIEREIQTDEFLPSYGFPTTEYVEGLLRLCRNSFDARGAKGGPLTRVMIDTIATEFEDLFSKMLPLLLAHDKFAIYDEWWDRCEEIIKTKIDSEVIFWRL